MKHYIIIDNEGWVSQFLHPTKESAIERGRQIYAPDGGLAERWMVVEVDTRTKEARNVYTKIVGE